MLVSISSYKTRLEAEIARGVLEAHNIHAIIQADDAGGMRVFPMQFTYGVDLLVEEQESKKAKALLQEKID